jgi:O-antigen/teichoic acid export membrane protein
LIAYWMAQLIVVGTTFVLARKMCVPRFVRSTIDVGRLRELGYYGLVSQMDGWAQFVNFQFDKFIIAGLVGLWGVAPYEVANRAIVALRSIPASGAETLLPVAMANQADRQQTWMLYLASTRMAAYGVLLFMLAPLVVAPVFLYAWTGEMGYLGRWVFVALSLGAMASVISLPAATLAQAEGRPGLQGTAALAAITINVPLSLLLVSRWGSAGAALGTAVAMTTSALLLIHSLHRHFGRPLKATVQLLLAFWPPVVICLCWMLVSFGVFGAWFETLAPASRYSRFTRVGPGLIAILVYALTVTSMIAVEFWRGAVLPRERTFLVNVLRGKWLGRRAPR